MAGQRGYIQTPQPNSKTPPPPKQKKTHAILVFSEKKEKVSSNETLVLRERGKRHIGKAGAAATRAAMRLHP
jgi:hypothetical protein